MNGCLVSNTGPLIALAVIDSLDLLRSIFDTVFVPEEVQQEMLKGGASGAGLTAYRQASWIHVHPLGSALDPLLRSVLDGGEAAVIQSARELGSDYVLIDERKARKVARKIYGMRVIGTARILVESKQRGFVDNVGDALNRMRAAGYWIHDDIVSHALTLANEK